MDNCPVPADRLEHHGFCAKQGERLSVLVRVDFALTADPDQVAAAFGRLMQPLDVRIFQKTGAAAFVLGHALLLIAFGTTTFEDQNIGIEPGWLPVLDDLTPFIVTLPAVSAAAAAFEREGVRLRDSCDSNRRSWKLEACRVRRGSNR